MPSIADMIRQADEQLRVQVNVAAGLAAAAGTEQLGEAQSLHDAAAAARRALAGRGRALEVAQQRVRQLDNAVVHLSRVLPFLAEGWAEQRDVLRRAISLDAREGLASWLNYWFAAASSRRIDALRRLESDVALPAAAATVAERMSVATRALAEKDWPLCREVLRIGAAGVVVGPRQIPDWTAPGDQEPGSAVREDLRLLAARLALHDGSADHDDDVLRPTDQAPPTAPRLALRSRWARLRADGAEAEALLRQARDLDPRDLDVTVESIAQARRRREPDTALDHARSAVGSLLSLNDIDGDIARLVDPPAELWIAAAERADDEGDRDAARLFLGRAAEIAPWNDDETAAVIAEQRADLAPSPAERRRALIYAGERRISIGQLERARRDYGAAASGPLADEHDADDAWVRASAQLRWADVVSAAAQLRPYRDVADELTRALEDLLAAQGQVDVSGAESWSYLTESDLRLRMSKASGAGDHYAQEWTALLAAARAVALNPAWARPWLTLAGAAAACGLYRVAEAAARRAYEIEDDDATRAGYVQALAGIGRYQEALGRLGTASDAWSQCIRGRVALSLGQANEAVAHFAGVTIDPAWFWAWYSYICALIIIGDLASARLKSEAFMEAAADREGERAWLYAAAFDARVHGRLDAALEFADRLSEAAGPGDVTGLRALGETLVLREDQAGWTLLAQALATDPLPAALGAWERVERPVLTALAADQGAELPVARLDLALRNLPARPHVSDPITELRRAAAAPAAPAVAPRAARLTEAALRAVAGAADQALHELVGELAAGDGLRAEAESLRRHVTGQPGRPRDGDAAARPPRIEGDRAAAAAAAAAPPLLMLRLPTSWLADPGQGDQLLMRYVPVPRPGRPWVTPDAQVSAGDDLEPDGYQILADGTLWSSGHVDPRLRYCPDEALALLAEQVRTSRRIVATQYGRGLPPDVLEGDHGLAALLTLSAAEVVALRYRDAASDLGVQLTPPGDDSRLAAGPDTGPRSADLPPPLSTHALAHRIWEMRGGDALDNWDVAQHLRHQLIAEAAYLHWIDRGRPFGDPLADWFAAVGEVDAGWTAHGPASGAFVDERLRHQLTERIAYFRWINRGRPVGDSWADWAGSESATPGGG
jgi:tetratricopeptide (TPR) repeat protein